MEVGGGCWVVMEEILGFSLVYALGKMKIKGMFFFFFFDFFYVFIPNFNG